MSCKRAIALTLFILTALAAGFSMAAVAPSEPVGALPDKITGAPAPESGKAAASVPVVPECVVAGIIVCSEYGYRYRELPRLVFTDGEHKYDSLISDTDGSFAVLAPCGRAYEMSIEISGRSMQIGRIDLTGAKEGAQYTLDIKHTGSYLELVRDVREGINEDDISFKLILPQD